MLYMKYSIVYKCVNTRLNGKWWPVLDALSVSVCVHVCVCVCVYSELEMISELVP